MTKKKKIFLTVLLGILALCIIVLAIDKLVTIIYRAEFIDKYYFHFIWNQGSIFINDIDAYNSYLLNKDIISFIFLLTILVLIVLSAIIILEKEIKYFKYSYEEYKKEKAEKEELKKQKKKEKLEKELEKLKGEKET